MRNCLGPGAAQQKSISRFTPQVKPPKCRSERFPEAPRGSVGNSGREHGKCHRKACSGKCEGPAGQNIHPDHHRPSSSRPRNGTRLTFSSLQRAPGSEDPGSAGSERVDAAELLGAGASAAQSQASGARCADTATILSACEWHHRSRSTVPRRRAPALPSSPLAWRRAAPPIWRRKVSMVGQ